MTRLTVDAATRARLQNLDGFMEVCDESGRVLGYFHPLGGSVTESRPSPFTEEELQKRRQQRTGRPLAEILKRLGNE
jgi:hypothetical protein